MPTGSILRSLAHLRQLILRRRQGECPSSSRGPSPESRGKSTGEDCGRHQRKTAGRIPAVGQEPQEFSVRLPFPFYCGRGGLANFGQAWIRMRGLHLEFPNQDGAASRPGTQGRRDESMTRSPTAARAHARVAELGRQRQTRGSGAARRGGSSPPSRILPQPPSCEARSAPIGRSSRPGFRRFSLGRA